MQNRPSLMALALVFARISLSSFGGGNSSWIRRELVEKRGWLTPEDFLAGFSMCLVLPGATGVNLAIYSGTRLRGGRGAVVACLGIVLPPMLIVLALGIFYAAMSQNPIVRHMLAGMGAGAAGMTLRTGVTSARDGLRDIPGWIGAVVATIAVGVFRLPILPVVAVMAPLQIAACYWRPRP